MNGTYTEPTQSQFDDDYAEIGEEVKVQGSQKGLLLFSWIRLFGNLRFFGLFEFDHLDEF